MENIRICKDCNANEVKKYSTYCDHCKNVRKAKNNRKYRNNYYSKNKELVKEQNKKYRKSLTKEQIDKKNEYHKNYYKKNKEKLNKMNIENYHKKRELKK